MPPKWLQLVFPPIVTGPTVMLIGVQLIASGFQNWAGGSGLCASMPETGLFSMCPDITAPHPLPWGSAEFIGKLSKFCNATLRMRSHQLTVQPQDSGFPFSSQSSCVRDLEVCNCTQLSSEALIAHNYHRSYYEVY